jgi:hypothetical protein
MHYKARPSHGLNFSDNRPDGLSREKREQAAYLSAGLLSQQGLDVAMD